MFQSTTSTITLFHCIFLHAIPTFIFFILASGDEARGGIFIILHALYDIYPKSPTNFVLLIVESSHFQPLTTLPGFKLRSRNSNCMWIMELKCFHYCGPDAAAETAYLDHKVVAAFVITDLDLKTLLLFC
ncbi:hypothetical protein RIF29_42012 [Crotalaria pallida]|uniref:Uncharacterized protein n=1 Tax=Crotalaria pallida TaxID=3830 RepID=A0AAN9EBN6_CROPI